MVRSLLWPGAVSFYQNGRIVQVYLGNGHKFEQQAPCYFPVHPLEIQADAEELESQPEPNPLEEPVVEEAVEEGDDAEEEEEEDDDDN